MAKSLMIQGTTSDAGKSFLTAALCRILKQDGIKVAPFKSQNMALNSFITKDGLEMGRAQVMQAEAAGIEPNVSMNPILLKPMTENGSQVILHGKVLEHMEAAQYFKYKQSLAEEVMKAYDQLNRAYDVILIEGAGSPAEINLRKNDIVNMGLAERVNAPVLLASDIDRGGVFAALAGTLMLLSSKERDRVKGLIINKFRGHIDLLEPGLRQIEEIVKVPVVGVVPMSDVRVDDEDSLNIKHNERKEGMLDVAVIQLPHLSNYTDLNALGATGYVGIRYVSDPEALGYPDMVVLPGSKNTIEDLRWLKAKGFEGVLRKYHQKQGVLFGICGGYQMLGLSIKDPYSIEGGGEVKGLGFLEMHTVFEKEKETVQITTHFDRVEGVFKDLSGLTITGYEIHVGQTTLEDSVNPLVKGGKGAYKGNVYGTYIHGVFDETKVVQTVINCLLAHRGLEITLKEVMAYESYKEKQYNALADHVRDALDMDFIYRIIEKGMN